MGSGAEALPKTHFLVLRESMNDGTRLVAANVVLFPLNKIRKSKQMWLFLNVYDYFLYAILLWMLFPVF